MKRIFPLIILITVSINLLAQDEFTLVKEGQTAPDFTIQLENGQTKKLSDLKGKVVWINFFATWCGPCRQELPHLQKDVYEKLKNNKDFELIILGRKHTHSEVDKFKTEQKFTMPFYADPERSIFDQYAKQNIPRNFIIDKEGKIAVSSSGYSEQEFEKIVKKTEALLN